MPAAEAAGEILALPPRVDADVAAQLCAETARRWDGPGGWALRAGGLTSIGLGAGALLLRRNPLIAAGAASGAYAADRVQGALRDHRITDTNALIPARREFASWFQAKVEKKGAPLMLWSWGGGDYFDPDVYLRGVFHPSSRYTLDTTPKIVELIDQSAATTDQAKRAEIFEEAQAVVKDEALAIFLYDPNDLYGVNKKLNWKPRSDERIVVWDAYFE